MCMKQKVKFNFKYAPTVILLLCIVIAISIVGLVWNFYNIFGKNSSPSNDVNEVFKYLVLVVNLLILVFSLSVLSCGRYVIDDNCVICRFGLIYSKYKKDEILSITHFKKSDKLVMYFKDEKFTVIVISPENYNAFIKAIKTINPSVVFSDEQEGNN